METVVLLTSSLSLPLILLSAQALFLLRIIASIKTWPATKTERDLFGRLVVPLKILMNAIFVFILIIFTMVQVLVGSVFITPVVATLVNVVILFYFGWLFLSIRPEEVIDSTSTHPMIWAAFKNGTYAEKCVSWSYLPMQLGICLLIISWLIRRVL